MFGLFLGISVVSFFGVLDGWSEDFFSSFSSFSEESELLLECDLFASFSWMLEEGWTSVY